MRTWLLAATLLGTTALAASAQDVAIPAPRLELGRRLVLKRLVAMTSTTTLRIEGEGQGETVQRGVSELRYEVEVTALEGGVIAELAIKILESRQVIESDDAPTMRRAAFVGRRFRVRGDDAAARVVAEDGEPTSDETRAVLLRLGRGARAALDPRWLPRGPLEVGRELRLDVEATRRFLHDDPTFVEPRLELVYRGSRAAGGRELAVFAAAIVDGDRESARQRLAGRFFVALDDPSIHGFLVEGDGASAAPRTVERDGQTYELEVHTTLRLRQNTTAAAAPERGGEDHEE